MKTTTIKHALSEEIANPPEWMQEVVVKLNDKLGLIERVCH